MNFKYLKKEVEQIKEALRNIFMNIINSDFEQSENVYSDYHHLIKENINNSNNITYIIHYLSKELFSTELTKDKIKLLNLIPEFYTPFDKNISITYPYLSRILTVLQNNLSLNIQSKIISEIFGKIISKLLDNSIDKKYYEICQGFCFYNMKQNDFKNQICGVLCLKQLIIKSNYFVEKHKYIKTLYEKIILFLDNNNFVPKGYLVELLGFFIVKVNKKYKPFVNITLYKLLNCIEINNINLKRNIIDVIGIIITLFPFEFNNVNKSLVNFLSILSKDKDNYINDKSTQILSKYKSVYDNKFNTIDSSKINRNIFKGYYFTSKSSSCKKYMKHLKIRDNIDCFKKEKIMRKNSSISLNGNASMVDSSINKDKWQFQTIKK